MAETRILKDVGMTLDTYFRMRQGSQDFGGLCRFSTLADNIIQQ